MHALSGRDEESGGGGEEVEGVMMSATLTFLALAEQSLLNEAFESLPDYDDVEKVSKGYTDHETAKANGDAKNHANVVYEKQKAHKDYHQYRSHSSGIQAGPILQGDKCVRRVKLCYDRVLFVKRQFLKF